MAQLIWNIWGSLRETELGGMVGGRLEIAGRGSWDWDWIGEGHWGYEFDLDFSEKGGHNNLDLWLGDGRNMQFNFI